MLRGYGATGYEPHCVTYAVSYKSHSRITRLRLQVLGFSQDINAECTKSTNRPAKLEIIEYLYALVALVKSLDLYRVIKIHG